MLGFNHLSRQQFGEKYYINGKAKVVGVVAHLTGKYANANNFVEFNVFDVGRDRLPNRKLHTHEVFYRQLDLSGKAFVVKYNKAIEVKDSFFVAFNIQDFLHGGFDGDTLGLYMAEDGSRRATDLLNFGRNVIQAHNHDHDDWKDFFTQNFSPIATHFAIYPLIEIVGATAVSNFVEDVETYRLTYINQQITAFFKLKNPIKAQFALYNIVGQLIKNENLGQLATGEQQLTLPLGRVPSGVYIGVLKTEKGQEARRFFIAE
jgi:hypothetical protein